MRTASDPFQSGKTGILLRIRLTPKAAANRIQGTALDETGKAYVKIAVTAVPEKGKANAALIKLLSKALKRPKTSLEVVSGASERNKVVAIAGEGEGDPAELERSIRAALDL